MAIIVARVPSLQFLSFAAGSALLAFLALWPAGSEAQRPSPVRVDKVVLQPLAEPMPVLGRVVSRMRGVVAAKTEGAVTKMRVQVGDRVAKGDVLAVLDIEKLTSERKARAATADAVAARAVAARARLERVEQEVARYEKLRRSAAFSKARLQDKEQEQAWLRSELDAARAQVAQARANLDLAEMNLARGTVRAPFDGAVFVLHTQVGSYLEEGDAVVSMVNERDLEIEAQVPIENIAELAPGTEVAVELWDGTTHKGRVRTVVPIENAVTRTRLVRFTSAFRKTAAPLAENAAARVVLSIGTLAPALTVHKDAIVRKGQKTVVFVARDGKADRRTVRLGRAVGTRFEVLDGLAEGDLAVIRGNERLRPGQPILLPDKAETAPKAKAG